MSIFSDVSSSLQELSNRRGVVALVLAALVIGIGPLMIFQANPKLFLELDTTKLMILSCGLTLPSLAISSACYVLFRKEESLDDRAARGIVLSSGILIAALSLALFVSWVFGFKGFDAFVWTTVVVVALIFGIEWSEHRSWRGDAEAGHFAWSEEDQHDFIEAHRKQFEKWHSGRTANRIKELSAGKSSPKGRT